MDFLHSKRLLIKRLQDRPDQTQPKSLFLREDHHLLSLQSSLLLRKSSDHHHVAQPEHPHVLAFHNARQILPVDSHDDLQILDQSKGQVRYDEVDNLSCGRADIFLDVLTAWRLSLGQECFLCEDLCVLYDFGSLSYFLEGDGGEAELCGGAGNVLPGELCEECGGDESICGGADTSDSSLDDHAERHTQI